MMKDSSVPGLAAATPHNAEDGAFGFQTPSPKSSFSKRLKAPSKTQEEAVLPHHYGGQEFFTPAEKLGTALKRIQTRLSSPFYAPRRLEDKFEGYPNAQRRTSLLLPGLIVTALLIGCSFWYFGNPVSNAPSSFTFRAAPISNTPSKQALNLFRKAYKTHDGGWISSDDPLNPGAVLVLLDQTKETTDRVLVTDSETRDFALDFETYLLEHLTTILHRLGETTSKYPLVEVTSYFSTIEAFPHVAESQYATPDGRTVLVEIQFSVPPNHDYVSNVIDTIQRYGELHSPDYVDVTYTGLPVFQSEMTTPTKDMQALHILLPESAPCMVAYRRVAERFGPGRISPYRIVFDGHAAGQHVNTQEAFAIMHTVMEAFAAVDVNVAPVEEEVEEDLETIMGIAAVNLDSIPQRTEDGHLQEHLGEVMDELYGKIGSIDREKIVPVYGVNGQEVFQAHRRTTYDGIAYLRNNPVPYHLFFAASLCVKKNKPHCPVEMLHLFTEMTDKLTSSDGMATYVETLLGVDPFSEYGIKWLDAARAKLDELDNNGALDGFKVYLDGGAALEYDAMNEVPLDSFGYLIWGLGAIVLLVLAKFAVMPLACRVKLRNANGHSKKK